MYPTPVRATRWGGSPVSSVPSYSIEPPQTTGGVSDMIERQGVVYPCHCVRGSRRAHRRAPRGRSQPAPETGRSQPSDRGSAALVSPRSEVDGLNALVGLDLVRGA